MLVALAANQNFRVVSMDIKAAFLQAKKLDREVFVRPPDDIRKEGKIWKLLKPLYGLDDASRKFYLKVNTDTIILPNGWIVKLISDVRTGQIL